MQLLSYHRSIWKFNKQIHLDESLLKKRFLLTHHLVNLSPIFDDSKTSRFDLNLRF